MQNFGGFNPMGGGSGGGRVVSERIVGSSNPIARYFRNFMKSVGGAILGVALFFGSFGVMWYSENFVKHSEVVVALPMSDSSALTEGTVKFDGPVDIASFAYAKPNNEPVLYYSFLEETCILEKYTVTETVTRNGQDVEQTVEKERNVWKGQPVEQWADFTVGGTKVSPSTAMQRLTLTNISQDGDYSGNTCVIGGIRHKTEAFASGPATRLIVVGDYLSGMVSGGTTFIISDLTNDQLVAKLQSEEKALFWMLKGIAVLMFAAGLTLIVSPILMLLNILPGLGKFLQILVFIVSFLLGIVVVLLATIILKLWWLILIIIIGLLVYTWKKKKEKS